MLRTLSEYGRAFRMRSCAFRIFDAATISIAFVIFLVFSTDLILPRISLPAAMTHLAKRSLGPRTAKTMSQRDLANFRGTPAAGPAKPSVRNPSS